MWLLPSQSQDPTITNISGGQNFKDTQRPELIVSA